MTGCWPSTTARYWSSPAGYSVRGMEDTKVYSEWFHRDFLRALACKKLDIIIEQNEKIIGLLEKILVR